MAKTKRRAKRRVADILYGSLPDDDDPKGESVVPNSVLIAASEFLKE